MRAAVTGGTIQGIKIILLKNLFPGTSRFNNKAIPKLILYSKETLNTVQMTVFFTTCQKYGSSNNNSIADRFISRGKVFAAFQ